MQKTPIFITFSGKKRSNWEKIQKKLVRASTADHGLFFQISHIWPAFIFGCQMLRTHFFFTFSGKTGQITIFGKKNLRASTRSHAPFFDKPKIWPTFIYLYHQFFKSSCVCSNSWPTKKNLRASTRTHDPFFDSLEIWPTFIYRGETPPDTFAKLPVHALINDPKKKLIQKSTTTHAPFLTTPKFDLLSYIYIINFLKSSCACSNSWPTKKNLRASTRTHDPIFDSPEIWPTFIYRGETLPDTFAKLPVRALINDPKKNWYRNQLQPMPHFLTTPKFDLLSYIYIINF